MTALSVRLFTVLFAICFYGISLFALPEISSLTPYAGPANAETDIIIRGIGFDGTSEVKFGSKEAAGFDDLSDQTIDATAPIGTPGNVTVQIKTPDGASLESPQSIYTYQGDWIICAAFQSSDNLTAWNASSFDETVIGGEYGAPTNIAFTEDGSKAYIVNQGANSVNVVDVETKELIAKIFGKDNSMFQPFDIVISGNYAYVTALGSDTVSVIDISTDEIVETIQLETTPGTTAGPLGIAATTTRIFVVNNNQGTVAIIDQSTFTILDTISVGSNPFDIAIDTANDQAYVSRLTTDPLNCVLLENISGVIPTPTPFSSTGIQPRGMAVRENSNVLYITHEDSTFLSLFDTTAVPPELMTTIPIGTSSFDLAIDESNKTGYATNQNSGSVTLIDLTTNSALSPSIGVGQTPEGIAISPDHSIAFVANCNSSSISVIDLSTNELSETIRGTFSSPFSVAITPDGTKAYVTNANYAGSVAIIDLATKTFVYNVLGTQNPGVIAITPDGTKAYVTNQTADGSVNVIDLTANAVVETIPVGSGPLGIAISPDGTKAYVANFGQGMTGDNTISVIDLETNTATNTIFALAPKYIAFTPNGEWAYVTGLGSPEGNVYVIDVASDTLIETITVGNSPEGISISSNGSRAYVANTGDATISVIDIQTNSVINTFNTVYPPYGITLSPDGKRGYATLNSQFRFNSIPAISSVLQFDPIKNENLQFLEGGWNGFGIAVTPDQAPFASFTVENKIAEQLVVFNASSSRSPVGSIASFAWDFGDGQTLTTTIPEIKHTYLQPGTYEVTLVVTNSKGTSTEQVFTGQTLSRNGGPLAITSQTIDIAPNVFPPRHLRGIQKSNGFITQKDIINILSWKTPYQGHKPAYYLIYRDENLTQLIGKIKAAHHRLIFKDHNRLQKTSYTYYIVSVDANGNQSEIETITVNPPPASVPSPVSTSISSAKSSSSR